MAAGVGGQEDQVEDRVEAKADQQAEGHAGEGRLLAAEVDDADAGDQVADGAQAAALERDEVDPADQGEDGGVAAGLASVATTSLSGVTLEPTTT